MNKTVSYDNKPLKFVSTSLKNQLTKASLFFNYNLKKYAHVHSNIKIRS